MCENRTSENLEQHLNIICYSLIVVVYYTASTMLSIMKNLNKTKQFLEKALIDLWNMLFSYK